jgi:sec-independent protein translocase protein TatB
MDILGIGPLELIFILIIALIVLGPKDMVKAGQTIGKFLRQIVTSPTWHSITKTSTELRNLPTKLIRDAGLEEDFKDIQEATKKAIPSSVNQDLSKWQKDVDSWTTPPTIGTHPTDDSTPNVDSSEAGTQTEDPLPKTEPDAASQSAESTSPDIEPLENQEQAD